MISVVAWERARWLAFPAFFVVAGLLHFVRPAFYADRLPHEIPAAVRLCVVVASGILEVILGALAVRSAMRRGAALAIFMIVSGATAVNVFALVTGRMPADLPITVQWLRAGFLAVLAAWALHSSRSRPRR